jgi:hypothetical protein
MRSLRHRAQLLPALLLLAHAACAGRPASAPSATARPPAAGARTTAPSTPATPAPPPQPVESHELLCAVDPSVWGGLRRVPADSAIAEVAGLPWAAARQPLELMAGRVRRRFAPYGVARIINAADLAFIGSVRGLPLFVAAADVEGVRGELEDAARSPSGLVRALEQRRVLRDRLDRVDVLYAPVQATGCIFQPLLRAR